MKNKKLSRNFYTKPTLIVAKELLGKNIVRKIGKKKIVGRIVETEAYIGPQDRASHSYQSKRTERNKAEYLKGGFIYIYLVYGMYWQLNITTAGEGEPECVLIRAIEPMDKKFKIQSSKLLKKQRKMTAGPGKLCRYLCLNKSFYGEDLCQSKKIWLESAGKKQIKPNQIIVSKRIGIDYAGPYWASRKWRFYLNNSPFISKK